MKFYIVTPAYNALKWLPGCVRSVADQVCDGIEVHHHIQDGGSEDGTKAWLANWQQSHADVVGYTFTFESGADDGMYDAINKAWSKMPKDADVTAHLNSDEQYLPGALREVSLRMYASSEVEVAVTAYIIADARGNYICHRRPILPTYLISRAVCELITCTVFIKTVFFHRFELCFDKSWRSIGDLVFYRDMMVRSPFVMIMPDLITSFFSVTGNNLGWSEVTGREWERYVMSESCFLMRIRRVLNLWCNIRRRTKDLFLPSPVEYSFYFRNEDVRKSRLIRCPTSHWGCREIGQE